MIVRKLLIFVYTSLSITALVAMHVEDVCTFPGHTDNILKLDFSPKGNYLASAGDTTIKIWDVHNRHASLPIQTLVHSNDNHNGPANFAWCPDGSHINSFAHSFVLRTWNVRSGTVVKTFSYEAEADRSENPWSVWAPDGRKFAQALELENRAIVRVINATDATKPPVILSSNEDFGFGSHFAWGPNSDVLANVNHMNRIYIWTFNPDGSLQDTHICRTIDDALAFAPVWHRTGKLTIQGSPLRSHADRFIVLPGNNAPLALLASIAWNRKGTLLARTSHDTDNPGIWVHRFNGTTFDENPLRVADTRANDIAWGSGNVLAFDDNQNNRHALRVVRIVAAAVRARR